MSRILASAVLLFVSGATAVGQQDPPPVITVQGQPPPPVITVQGQSFPSWPAYTSSTVFRSLGLRCGTKASDSTIAMLQASDCAINSTTIRPRYAPEGHTLYRIPVVVHVLQSSAGEGQISDAMVQSQIDVLNEDMRAIAGTAGDGGTDARIEFFLATADPAGNPTKGITRTTNDDWFEDDGNYWDVLAWDPRNYLNIYTNSAGGALGYVHELPQSGNAGTSADRVVILWAAFGRNAPVGPPYDMGRTATHEIGHYLGLYHTFDFGCGSPADCHTSGDLICDTEPEAVPVYGCPSSSSSCGSADPFHNYMDYSDDACYVEFTAEQVNRMRCTLDGWRPQLSDCVPPATAVVRNAGVNLAVYSATAPVMGGGTTLSVVAPGYTSAVVLGHGAPASVLLSQGYVLLVDGPTFFQVVLPLPSAGVNYPIPDKAALCGRTVYTQAILFAGSRNALTNAVDLTIGR